MAFGGKIKIQVFHNFLEAQDNPYMFLNHPKQFDASCLLASKSKRMMHLWACGRRDVSTPSFGSHLIPISTGGDSLKELILAGV